MIFAWYCPSEGDGHFLGTRLPERAPDFGYLLKVTRAAEDAGAEEILIPTGIVNDSFSPEAPFMESWTTAAGLAAATERIRLIVAVNPAPLEVGLAAHQIETLERIAPGRIAINLVAGGGPDTGYGTPKQSHDRRYAKVRALVDAVRPRFDGPFYLGGASDAALALVADHVDTYLMWGEPPEKIAARVTQVRHAATRAIRMGLRIHIIARAREDDARQAAEALLSRSQVRDDRSREFAAFDSIGQRRMNLLDADSEGWLAPGLWAGVREVRGGAGTALVGSYDQVASWLDRYRTAGIDLVIASGYPHLEEVGRVGDEVWPRLPEAQAA